MMRIVMSVLLVAVLAMPSLVQAKACIAVLGGDWDDCRPRASAAGEPREWCGGNGAGGRSSGRWHPTDIKAVVDAYVAKVVAAAVAVAN
jgi:hypothetical protein